MSLHVYIFVVVALAISRCGQNVDDKVFLKVFRQRRTLSTSITSYNWWNQIRQNRMTLTLFLNLQTQNTTYNYY